MFNVRFAQFHNLTIVIAIFFALIQLPVAVLATQSVSAAPNSNANARAHEQLESNNALSAVGQKNNEQPQEQNSNPSSQVNYGQLQKARVQSAENGSVNSESVTNTVQEHKITICHATSSQTNPYVRITVAKAAAYHAHISHQDGRDIIPPFTYEDQTYSQNWNATGQVIYNNGCDTGGSILGETISGSRGGGNISHADSVSAGQLANTGAAITMPLFAAATVIAITCGLAVPAGKFQNI